MRNFYSVSISGYHIAEAGANPITQLAFTLANGFTYVESYLARGMDVDDFAPNLSFFFSNGMDPEYTVLGRVARRIWAIAMRDRYGADERAQKLKYHVQTSGRSLHAQEMAFNDIRTTLQALCAIYDNCNSLHTNAYDEAVTTPTEESVRRALAIQLIINREWGLATEREPPAGQLRRRGADRPGRGGGARRVRAASASAAACSARWRPATSAAGSRTSRMLYEQRKHDGSLPIVGVNTFLDPPATPVADPHRARPVHRRGEAAAARPLARLPGRARPRPGGGARPASATRPSRGQHLRGADGRTCAAAPWARSPPTLFEVGGRYRRNV